MTSTEIGFLPIQVSHFQMLWEWRHRPHVMPWWESWSPPTFEASVVEWTKSIEGKDPGRGYLVTMQGQPIGYIQSYRLQDEPKLANDLGLEGDVVGADLYIAEPDYLHRGLGPIIVGLFYLWMMDRTGVGVGIIDPLVRNRSAIRAYEKAGFRFLKVVAVGDYEDDPGYIMMADRETIDAALTANLNS
ncbi:MAG TPA: GNAT family N-acetyltransferase [Candidatus Dormibacteraeota bacterium]|jgi:RimJ/RimL family protein N-acetyltransferase|nr:GNAT family N-acetyltransferase [Candidatus Dormibacteraeota bacterium]